MWARRSCQFSAGHAGCPCQGEPGQPSLGLLGCVPGHNGRVQSQAVSGLATPMSPGNADSQRGSPGLGFPVTSLGLSFLPQGILARGQSFGLHSDWKSPERPVRGEGAWGTCRDRDTPAEARWARQGVDEVDEPMGGIPGQRVVMQRFAICKDI